MTAQHLELALSRYRRLTVALGQLDPEKHMSQMDNHYLAMGAEIARLQAQVDALSVALQALMRADMRGHELADRLQFSTPGREILDKCRSALVAAGR